MLVEVVVDNLPYVGKRGTVRDIRDPEARVLVLLGKVQPHVPAKKEEKIEEEVKPVRKRRTYRRRDMVAEAVEEVTEVGTAEESEDE